MSAHPDLIGAAHLDPMYPIRDALEEIVRPRVRVVDLHRSGLQPRLSHEPRHPFTPHPDPCSSQRLMNTRRPIAALAGRVHLLNPPQQVSVLFRVHARPSALPAVIARAAYPVALAHRLYRVLTTRSVDEREDRRLAWEQNRMAFFRSSCSSLSKA